MTGSDYARRRIRVQREAEILGEMIERAERKHPERNVRAGKDVRDGADTAVAAANDDRVNLPALCLLERPLGRRVQILAVDEDDLCRNAIMAKADASSASMSEASFWLKAPAPAFISATTRLIGTTWWSGRSRAGASAMVEGLAC